MPLSTHGFADGTIDVLKVMSNDWYDVETNEVIPHEEIGQITNRLIEAGKLIDESKKPWVQAIRSNGGDKEAATKAAEHIISGGYTKIYDQLSQHKCLVNLRIVGPPVMVAGKSEKETAAEYKWHQMAMHDVIVRLAPGLQGLIFDLFTSRTELKDNGQAAGITYVRFPYYHGTSVVSLCGELNMVHIGQYVLKASWHTRSSLFVGIDADAWTH